MPADREHCFGLEQCSCRLCWCLDGDINDARSDNAAAQKPMDVAGTNIPVICIANGRSSDAGCSRYLAEQSRPRTDRSAGSARTGPSMMPARRDGRPWPSPTTSVEGVSCRRRVRSDRSLSQGQPPAMEGPPSLAHREWKGGTVHPFRARVGSAPLRGRFAQALQNGSRGSLGSTHDLT
jgi:hypothetical protein